MSKENCSLEKKIGFLKDVQSNATNVRISTGSVGRIKPQTIVLKKHYHYSVRGG